MHSQDADTADAMPGLPQFLAHFTPILTEPFRNRRGHPANRPQLLEAYGTGLLMPGERKSMQPIAEKLDADWDRIQHFVTYSPWDYEAMQAKLREVMRPHTTPKGWWVLDPTSQSKRGNQSVGTARQYLGCVGKVANGQVAVCLNYCAPSSRRNADALHWPLAQQLYLPTEWTDNPERLRKANVPATVEFQEKWRIALRIIDQLRSEAIPHEGVVFDAEFGDNGAFRRELRDRGEAYIGGVTTTKLRVLITRKPKGLRGRLNGPCTPKRIAEALPGSAWHRIRWPKGDQTSRSAKFARVRVGLLHDGQPTGEEGWLLLERRSDELKAYVCVGVKGNLRALALKAHHRWTVEKEFEELKGEVGWDQFEGRSWLGWHHHASISMVCYAYLQTQRAGLNPPGNGAFESVPR